MNETIRALEEQLARVESKHAELETLNALAFELRHSGHAASKEYALRARELAERLGDHHQLILSICHQGFSEMHTQGPQVSIPLFYEAIALAEKYGDMRGRAQALYYLGVGYARLADLQRSTEYHNEALALAREAGDERIASACLNHLAHAYSRLNDPERGYETAKEAYALAKQAGVEQNMGTALMHMGTSAAKLKQYDEAFRCMSEALELRRRIQDLAGVGASLGMFAEYYIQLGEYDKAAVYVEESLGMAKKYDIRWAQPMMLQRRANILIGLNKIDEAMTTLEEARVLTASMDYSQDRAALHELFAKVYEIQGDHKKALEEYKLFFNARQEVLTHEATRNLENQQLLSRIEKAQQESEIHRLKNVELKQAYDEIRDSISYARRIQEAILPAESEVRELLPDSFVLFRPRDIVSGDFYFAEPLQREGRSLIAFAAADCTGHGVPGAFMSILGYDILRQALDSSEVRTAGEALDFLNSQLSLSLRQQAKTVQMRDGMDISFCLLDKEKRTLHFSGANNPCWIVRSSGSFEELPADKQPVGFFENQKAFTSHDVQLQAGDCIYLFSDGYADQFGGPQGKKFKRKKLKELLRTIAPLPPAEQQERLQQAFSEWQGNLEQIDDVLVIGVRIS